jgi:hypothetical protein
VAIAKGKHPVPFRTRKLSSSAPMVLRGGPRGRVGRRRTTFLGAASPKRPPLLLRPACCDWCRPCWRARKVDTWWGKSRGAETAASQAAAVPGGEARQAVPAAVPAGRVALRGAVAPRAPVIPEGAEVPQDAEAPRAAVMPAGVQALYDTEVLLAVRPAVPAGLRVTPAAPGPVPAGAALDPAAAAPVPAGAVLHRAGAVLHRAAAVRHALTSQDAHEVQPGVGRHPAGVVRGNALRDRAGRKAQAAAGVPRAAMMLAPRPDRRLSAGTGHPGPAETGPGRRAAAGRGPAGREAGVGAGPGQRAAVGPGPASQEAAAGGPASQEAAAGPGPAGRAPGAGPGPAGQQKAGDGPATQAGRNGRVALAGRCGLPRRGRRCPSASPRISWIHRCGPNCAPCPAISPTR